MDLRLRPRRACRDGGPHGTSNFNRHHSLLTPTRYSPPSGLAIAARAAHVSLSMLTRLITLAWIALAAFGAPVRAAESAPAPYDRDLQRLAEILGALHYLRALCGANEGAKWRNEMQALVDAETPSGERRDKLIAGFNRGYR